MFFNFFMKKTVKELRKNRCLTAKELAEKVKVDTIDIMKIDHMKLSEVPESLQSLIKPILSGEETDKIPWL